MYNQNTYNQPLNYDPNYANTGQYGYGSPIPPPQQAYTTYTPVQHPVHPAYEQQQQQTHVTYATPGTMEGGYGNTIPPQGEKFKPVNEYRDLPFLILFIIHFLGFIAVIVAGFLTPVVITTNSTGNATSSVGVVPSSIIAGPAFWHFVGILLALAAAAIFISSVYLQLMKMFPVPMIYAGIVLTVLSFFGGAAWLAYNRSYFGAVILGVFGLFMIIYFFVVRARIPFAVEMIKAVVKIIQNYPGTQVTAFGFLFVKILWMFLWSVAFIAAQRFNGPLYYVAFVFLIFSYYWTFEVLKNIVHVSVSGVVATVYFMANNMPENPSVGALKRALTTSFGSICLGSLIVAFLKTVRALIRMMRSESNSILLCLVDCILSCFESLIRYFNHYAYCQVAIYGKTFCQAASATWDLIQRAGLEAIANDNLIGGVLNMGICFGALLTGAIGALLGLGFNNMFTGNDVLVFFFLGLLIGALLMALSMQVVDSGVTCMFVCFAEDRGAVLHATNPVLYQNLVTTYNVGW